MIYSWRHPCFCTNICTSFFIDSRPGDGLYLHELYRAAEIWIFIYINFGAMLLKGLERGQPCVP